MTLKWLWTLGINTVVVLVVSAAAPKSQAIATQSARQPLRVVASFSIIADMAQHVGGDHIHLTTLVGPNEDAHVYEPRPADAVAVGKADVVLINGLKFEGFLPRLATASHTRAPIIELTKGIDKLTSATHEHDDDQHHHHGKHDPHAWQSVHNATVYVTNIANAFCTADAKHCDDYQANANTYNAQLKKLDKSIHNIVADIPTSQRTVITSHDGFNYFERDYGIRFLAAEGLSTESEPSAADVARLIDQIRDEKAAALFTENMASPKLIKQIARETGIAVGGDLYADALAEPDQPAGTYIGMMRSNALTISQALAP